MEEIIEQLRRNGRASAQDLASELGVDAAEVESKIQQLQADGVILGFTAVLDSENAPGSSDVSAVIEVKVTPERDGGFDRLAKRIARFDQVESCTLMSGGYDLSVVVTGESLQDVASFVAEKLSTLEGVISTATHFHLKTYKRDGFLAQHEAGGERLPVSP